MIFWNFAERNHKFLKIINYLKKLISTIKWLNEPKADGATKYCDFNVEADVGIKFIEEIRKVF